MRASKLEGSIAAGEKQQRQRGHRPDDGRSAWRLSEAALAGHSGAIAERDLRTETGETGGNPEAGRRRGAKAWHPDAPGIIHLIQFVLGMVGEDGLKSRPIFGDAGRRNRRW